MPAIKPRARRLIALATAYLNDPRRRGVPLVAVPPCYWVVDRLGQGSVMIDMGLGFDADFSQAMIARFGLTSYGYDPTRKHLPALQAIAAGSGGRFHVQPAAISPKPGTAQFYESRENVSGSLMAEHPNVRNDAVDTYDVQLLTLAEVFDRCPHGRADLVKMDIEGSEYEVLESVDDEVLRRADQWVIEYHHDMTSRLTFARTLEHIRRFARLGYQSYTRDNVNFLFYAEAGERMKRE